ncbi:MAG: lamin tail domain-containing protein [Kofleriaceae bacterium]|nr:lamin tail domain-containing protein [Myxococcales bacterium]MCB9561166.1 lamin tail domain-containing protein [Kofleriaceae bacterium]MCB9571362.1 lamin tail domain-containing protein [Kofleriaceae bacterium]
MLRATASISLACALLASACARDPEPEICPAAGPGDLVISEVRGPQAGGDTWGQWVELYNASGATLDLEGTVVDLVSVDGSHRYRILVRRGLEVGAGAYAVIGDFPDATRPTHVDYGAGYDLDGAFPATGGLTVTGCGGEVLDRLVFDGLPPTGTWSLGDDPPTADGNDDPTAWCADTTPGDTTELGLPGTPGAANHPCPVP